MRPELPVIMSSGYLCDQTRAEAMRLGVRRFVRKEHTIDELVPAIQEVVASLPR